jgi:hypothetical protein
MIVSAAAPANSAAYSLLSAETALMRMSAGSRFRYMNGPTGASMTYVFTIEGAETYVHVSGSGENTADNLRRFMLDAYRAAVDRRCQSLLMELNFAGPSLDLASIFAVVSERSPDASDLKNIACIDRNPEHSPERAEFAVLAANRLGVNVRLFDRVEDAQGWLQGSGDRPCRH